MVSRWSDHNVELPAMVVRPNSKQDIVDSIMFARNSNLTLIPGNGGCASWVPITTKTMYLDMKNFNNVVVNQSSRTVRIGGGASTGETIKTVVAAGYYTLWCNSNAVGYVGSILGGGISPFTGLHGFLIDAIEAIEIITTDGKVREVGPSSEGDEKALFNAPLWCWSRSGDHHIGRYEDLLIEDLKHD
ncbi:FAD-linked oxidoreductase azaL [Paramyrothecium foliicola]|nr:FAD-linked oxidoreductase azaL [Paramyrothecium foliicola]